MRIAKPSKPRTRDVEKGKGKPPAKTAYGPISRPSSPRKGR